jgi:hypothetical protein
MQNCGPEKNPEKSSNLIRGDTAFGEFNIGDHNKCLHLDVWQQLAASREHCGEPRW